MIRRCTVLALMFAAVTALAGGGGDDTILIDNFDNGKATDWEVLDFTGVGVAYVYKGQYVIETTEPIPIDDPSVGTVDADWSPSEGDPKFANGTLRGTIRANTDGTTVGFLLRDSHETESDYGFFGSTSFGTFYIERYNYSENPDAPQTIIAMADPEEFPFRAGEDWNIEVTVVGDKLELKAWRVGDPEPKHPMLKVKDKLLPPGSGIAAIVFFDPLPLALQGVDEVRVSGTFDNITFTPKK